MAPRLSCGSGPVILPLGLETSLQGQAPTMKNSRAGNEPLSNQAAGKDPCIQLPAVKASCEAEARCPHCRSRRRESQTSAGTCSSCTVLRRQTVIHRPVMFTRGQGEACFACAWLSSGGLLSLHADCWESTAQFNAAILSLT